jgi:hypothetical protein
VLITEAAGGNQSPATAMMMMKTMMRIIPVACLANLLGIDLMMKILTPFGQ